MSEQPNPLWNKTHPLHPTFTPLQGAVKTDVVIVGAGITGLTAAALLIQAGKSVIVLEADDIASNMVCDDMAQITALLDTRYHEIVANFGVERARLTAEAHTEAIEQIASFISAYHLDCNFKWVDGYLYIHDRGEIPTLEKEFHAMHGAGLSAGMKMGVGLPSPIVAALYLPNQAQFHPRKYLHGLANELIFRGCEIHTHSPAVAIEENDSQVSVKTPQGMVRAESVFLATHTPLALHIEATIPTSKRIYTNNLTGNGMTYANITARLVSNLIQGQDTPITDLSTVSGMGWAASNGSH